MKSIFCLLLLSSGLALGQKNGTLQISPDAQRNSDTSYFQIRAGTMWRKIGKTDIDPKFTAGSDFLALPSGVGSATATGNRTYDNGFVNIGSATPLTGLTTNFGYTSGPPQVGDNLVFSRGGGAAVGLPTGGRDDADVSAAPYLDFSYIIPIQENLEVGINLNFSFGELSGRFRSNVALSSVTTVDTFALNGVIVPSGNYSGPVGGAAPLIPNIPKSRQQNIVQTVTDQYYFKQDTDLYSLALGPDLRWMPMESIIVSIGAGVVLNIADWSAESNNPAVNPANADIIRNVASTNGQEMLIGLYLKATASYQIDENWGIESFFRYDWTENFEASAGATDFTVDLTGWSLGVGVSHRF